MSSPEQTECDMWLKTSDENLSGRKNVMEPRQIHFRSIHDRALYSWIYSKAKAL